MVGSQRLPGIYLISLYTSRADRLITRAVLSHTTDTLVSRGFKGPSGVLELLLLLLLLLLG